MKSQWGTLGFDQYKIQCIIGTHEHERTQLQEIKVDLKVETNLTTAAATDNLEDTVNYSLLAELCEKTAKEGQYHLLEAYASAVLDKIEAAFNVKKIWIRVCKTKAITAADCAFVELSREC